MNLKIVRGLYGKIIEGKRKGELCNYIPISNTRKVILEVCVISVTKGCTCLAKFTRKVKEVI